MGTRDVATVTDDLGADLDQLLAQLVNDHGSAVFGNGMPYHVTLLDAAGLEVEAWAVDGDGRRVANFSGPR